MAERDLLKQARDDFKVAEDFWAENRKHAKEDMLFRAGNQWPDDIKKQREDAGLPCITVDKLNQYVRQIVNDGRQNRPAPKVRPVDDKGDVKVADAMMGLIRQICRRSRADQAFDTALEHAVVGGFGYFRILTEYAHENTFNQEIVFKRVRNPLAVLLGPHQEADGSDARFGFVMEDVPKDDYKRRWPKAKATNWQDGAYSDGWSADKTVRVCEYFYKEDVPVTLHLLADGTSATDEDYQAAVEKGEQPPKIVESREIAGCRVKWCRLSGAEILEENKWLGKYIPIIPVYGEEIDIDGKVSYRGIVRSAKDPQRLYNYSRSAFASRVALTPKAPWVAAAEAINGHPEWATANTGTHAVLTFNAFTDDGTAIPPPERVDPSDVPAGFAQDMQLAEHDIQGAIGMYNSSIGERSNEKSGRAIMARQREGDVATFHYPDNQNRAIEYACRQLVDLAPKIYDSRRLVRLLGEDGNVSEAYFDPQQSQAVTKGDKNVDIYNIGLGIYDVSMESGPSYTTRRQESADAMMEMTRANPGMWSTHGDLVVKAQDWPNAEEFAKRSLLTMPPQIREAIEAAEHGDEQSPQVMAVKQQAQQIIDEAMGRAEQAQAAAQQLARENEELKEQSVMKARELDIKAYEAETERLQVIAPAVPPDQVQSIVRMTVTEIMAQPVTGPGAQPPPEEPEPEMVAAPPGPPPTQPPAGGFFTPGGSE